MKTLSLVFMAMVSVAQANDREPLTEETAAGIRAMHGIQDLAKEADAEYFAFRQDGKFMVSTKAFSSRQEAAAFCASKPGYQLTQGLLPGVLAMFSLPFVNLHKQMILSSPVLGRSGNTSGVVSWIEFDLAKIPADSQIKPEDLEVIALLKAGNFLLAFTNGDGGEGDGIYSSSLLNERLRALGQAPIALSAICVDDKVENVSP